MALIKLGHESCVADVGQRIIKESYDRCVVLIRAANDNYYCLEVPDASYAQYDADKLLDVPGCRKHSVYKDSDGTLWANLTKAVKPEVDKSCRAVKYGPGAEVPDCPPPLVPFAGCDRKAMAPSPAKPFSMTASPMKPSPFKERVDTATEAVVRKTNWSDRQAKMAGQFFAAPAAGAAAAGAGGQQQQRKDVPPTWQPTKQQQQTHAAAAEQQQQQAVDV